MLILIPTLVFWISNPNFLFGQICAKKVKVVRFNWKLTHMVSWKCRFRIRTWIFEIPTPKFIFVQIWVEKNQNCLFFLTMLILIPILAFWMSDPKSIFGKIWAKKVKVVQFGRKLAHRVSRQCWFVFRHYFSQFSTLNPFLGKLGLKKSKLFVLPENWHTRTYTHSISKMLILISILVFSNFKP